MLFVYLSHHILSEYYQSVNFKGLSVNFQSLIGILSSLLSEILEETLSSLQLAFLFQV